MRKRLLAAASAALLAGPAAATEPPAGSWSFAVSGDSRDCGNLVMPKIARAVAQEPDVAFYWHLGDFRRMYDVDCDVLLSRHPDYDCKARPTASYTEDEMSRYEETAWSDFVEKQVRPFGGVPVFLGIGNHELYGRTREQFAEAFRPWLSQKRLHLQRLLDAKREIDDPGPTSYHFVHRGVDFIYLDNADEASFTSRQLVWLRRVLAADAKDDSVKAIVVGMHEALPYSASRIHAMDASCQGLCSGQSAYDLLYRAQNLAGPPEKRKRVVLLASHAHTFLENVYDTPEHQGQVLPGWIVGTAGAVQTSEAIRYGWLKVAVSPDGSFTPEFREVGRTTPPLASGRGAEALTEFCFTLNKREPKDDSYKGDCACGAVR